MKGEFFRQRPEITPTIYVYSLVGVASHKGYVKIGYTERNAPDFRAGCPGYRNGVFIFERKGVGSGV